MGFMGVLSKVEKRRPGRVKENPEVVAQDNSYRRALGLAS